MPENYISVSGPDLKSFKTLLQWSFMDHKAADVAPEMAIENGIKKFLHFAFFTLNLQFDPTVNQIFHRAEHVVPCGDRFDGIPEAHALDASFV